MSDYSKYDKYIQELVALESVIETLVGEHSELKTEKDVLEKKIEELQQENQHLQNEVNSLREEMEHAGSNGSDASLEHLDAESREDLKNKIHVLLDKINLYLEE